jgi:glutamine phosphoribosylpyrophosphate amidotransferase
MIGHIRYSTSDVRFNQPFSNDKYAIVHNGVISQESPENWPIKCETRNDSEMVLHALSDFKNYKHPLEEFPDSSQAVVFLQNSSNVLGGWRNGLRPLWYSWDAHERLILASTENILKRAGIKNAIKAPMNVELFMEGDELYQNPYHPTNKKDLQ